MFIIRITDAGLIVCSKTESTTVLPYILSVAHDTRGISLAELSEMFIRGFDHYSVSGQRLDETQLIFHVESGEIIFQTDRELPPFMNMLVRTILNDFAIGSTYFSNAPSVVSRALYLVSTGECASGGNEVIGAEICPVCLNEFLPVVKMIHHLCPELALKTSNAVHKFHYGVKNVENRRSLETQLAIYMMRALGARDCKKSVLDIEATMRMFPTQSGKAMAGKIIQHYHSKVTTPELAISTLQLIRHMIVNANQSPRQ